MSKLKLIFIILIAINIGWNELSAQKKGGVFYNLDQCIEIARRKNFDIELSYAQVEASSAQITDAFGDFLPGVTLNARYDRQLDNVLFTNFNGQIIQLPESSFEPNSFSLSAIANYTIFNGFARESNYSRSQDNYNANLFMAQFNKSNVIIQVYQNYIDVIRKSKIVELRNENLETGKSELKRIQAQKDAGLIPVTAVYSQEADLANREYELVVAENNLDLAKANLLAVMGLEPTIEAEFDPGSLPDRIDNEEMLRFRERIGSLNTASVKALDERLDMQSQELRIEAAESQVNMASAGYYPSLSAFGGWSWTNYQIADFGPLSRSFIGLNLSIPIFENFNTNNQIQSAQLQVKQQEIEKRRLEQNIRTSVKTGLLSLDATEKQIEISDRAVKSSQINYDSNNERFKVGAANINDVIIANNQLISSKINQINAIYDYYQVQMELLFAIGQLSD